MASESKKDEEGESSEFADFLADVSQEIAQRVESLDAKAKVPPDEKRKTPIAPEAGTIVEWPNIADRMIEEMR